MLNFVFFFFFFFFGRALKPELKNICVSVVCHANPTLKVFFCCCCFFFVEHLKPALKTFVLALKTELKTFGVSVGWSSKPKIGHMYNDEPM